MEFKYIVTDLTWLPVSLALGHRDAPTVLGIWPPSVRGTDQARSLTRSSRNRRGTSWPQ